jgi:hypothetical protein
MAEALGTTNRYRWPAVFSAPWVLLTVAVAVAVGGVVPWVRWTAAAVAILIVVGLFVLARRLSRPPRPAGYDVTASLVAGSSWLLVIGQSSEWQGDAPLLVLAGVLGSIPFLALIWWRALRSNRTADAGQPP